MDSKEIITVINHMDDCSFNDMKVSYVILKPNAAKHYKHIIKDIMSNHFTILGQYAIFDYDTVNMTLHQDQPASMRYIIPISRMFKDFYGNYGILVVLGKSNISYPNFCLQVVGLKRLLRTRFDLPYVAYAFNTSLLGENNKKQHLLIQNADGTEETKNRFNDEGTYMVFFTNEIHSPDEDMESTEKEMKLLYNMGIMNDSLIIPKPILHNVSRYHTFEFFKDLL